ncbi:CP family cyanate transporter-like MFS transporter [Janthinobacterium sp. 35]|uniref:MFS transporter n=1 Tax=Janthinobacterium sp. 35 TaxID=2035210 RepID=UPI000C19E5C9|nr:MFS transporter [Janthinobacterium sp. 35]PIG28644.1 CP family cyanate transporter-like MFS transporter [Janthinobacterium sp. 35]
MPSARPAASPSSSASSALLVAAIILLGLNLRPILAAIGPLLDSIQASTGISNADAGLLTTVPVFAMGVCALAGAQLQRRLGVARGIGIGIAIIAAACALRWPLHDSGGLIATAALGGLGIALVQALLPAFIKRHFPARAGQLMGFYTTGIMGGAAIAAASASPLAQSWGWNALLALWALPAVAAALLWRRAAATRVDVASGAGASLPVGSGRAWLLMVFFGIGTGAYTLVLAWLPPFYTELGWSAADSGLLLGALTLVEVLAGLVISSIIHRFPDRRILLLSVLLSVLGGLACLIVAPAQLALPAVILLGCGIGALFPLSLIVSMDHVTDPAGAGALLGFVQGGGYIIASSMPFIAGLIRQHSSSLAQAWMVMAGGVVLLLLIAVRFAPGARLASPAGKIA